MGDPNDNAYLDKIGEEARQFQRNVINDVYRHKIDATLTEEYLSKALQALSIGTIDPIGTDVGTLMITALQLVTDTKTDTVDLGEATRLLIVAAWRTIRALNQQLDRTINPGPDTETTI